MIDIVVDMVDIVVDMVDIVVDTLLVELDTDKLVDSCKFQAEMKISVSQKPYRYNHFLTSMRYCKTLAARGMQY